MHRLQVPWLQQHLWVPQRLHVLQLLQSAGHRGRGPANLRRRGSASESHPPVASAIYSTRLSPLVRQRDGRNNRRMRLVFAAGVALAACVVPEAVPAQVACVVIPTSARLVGGGYTVVGKGDRDVFIYPFLAGVDKHAAEVGPEKMLVFLANASDSPPKSIVIEGTNLRTGTRRMFSAGLQHNDFGTAWGTNFDFPDAGCWRLSVSVAGNVGVVTIEVK